MTVNYIELGQLVLALFAGSFLGLVALQVTKDTSIWCLVQSHPGAIAVFYKGKLVKNKTVVAVVKLLRTIVLKIAK
jgi:hypothetical protein